MAKLIVTIDNNIETFRIYDLKTKKKIFSKKKISSLSCVDLIDSGKHPFRPFGIDTCKNNIYIASNEKIGVFDKKTYKFKRIMDVKCYVNTHQILLNDNLLYVTHTATDTLGIHNLLDSSVKYLNVRNLKIILSVRKTKHPYKHDDCHLNSLCLYNKKIYFCLNNINLKPSGYYCYNPENEKTILIKEVGFRGHGIVIIDNNLYTLSTGTGELLKINLKSKKVSAYKVAIPEHAFLRGLAEYNGNLLIGQSNNYASKKEQFKAYISIFDIKTLKNELFIEFKKGEIMNDFKVIV